MRSFLPFIIHPTLVDDVYSFKQKLIFCVNAICFIFLTRLPLTFVLLVEKFFSVTGISEILDANTSGSEDLHSISIILWIALWAPIIEEISFRGCFSRNKNIILISISTLPVVLLNVIYAESPLRGIVSLSIRVLISVLLIVILFYVLKKYKEQLSVFVLGNLRFLIYLSAAVFAFLHLVNYDLPKLSVYQIIIIPVALSPYLSLALALNFIRVHCGLHWSIGFHAINNAVFLVLFTSFR